jgi:hypothetical protein
VLRVLLAIVLTELAADVGLFDKCKIVFEPLREHSGEAADERAHPQGSDIIAPTAMIGECPLSEFLRHGAV